MSNDGHVELDSSADKSSYLCDFIVGVNHIDDLLSNLSLPTSSELGDLSDLTGVVSSELLDALNNAGGDLGNMLTLYDSASCEAYVDSTDNVEFVELYFVTLVEMGLL